MRTPHKEIVLLHFEKKSDPTPKRGSTCAHTTSAVALFTKKMTNKNNETGIAKFSGYELFKYKY